MTKPQADIAEWEAERHQDEVGHWAAHLDEFEKRLPSLRRNRLGDALSLQMVGDVLAEVGEKGVAEVRDRLMDAWRDGRGHD